MISALIAINNTITFTRSNIVNKLEYPAPIPVSDITSIFGTAGIKVLSSKDAKNVYTHCTAGVLRAKDCVMKTANTIQENCGDIYAGAKDINEARAQKAAEADCEDAESTETAEEEAGAEE